MTPDGQALLKYAHQECELRFLVPDRSSIPRSKTPVHLVDRYITGTRLRLRTVEDLSGVTTWKLGQKSRLDEKDASSIAHTSVYLNEEEYHLLAALPASTLSKTRSVVPLGPEHDVAIDVFEGQLTGLVLAEVDTGSSRSYPPVPDWLGREVTSIDAFTGHALSQLNASQLAELLPTSSSIPGSAPESGDGPSVDPPQQS